MKTFIVNIVTPSGIVYDHEAKFLVADTQAGSLGVLPNHAPLISPLKISALRIDRVEEIGDTSDWVAVNGGIIEIRDNVVSIIANSAEMEKDIDISRAEEAKRRANEKIEQAKQNGNQDIDLDRAKISLYRALNRLEVASKNR